jgi:hypothetical protein
VLCPPGGTLQGRVGARPQSQTSGSFASSRLWTRHGSSGAGSRGASPESIERALGPGAAALGGGVDAVGRGEDAGGERVASTTTGEDATTRTSVGAAQLPKAVASARVAIRENIIRGGGRPGRSQSFVGDPGGMPYFGRGRSSGRGTGIPYSARGRSSWVAVGWAEGVPLAPAVALGSAALVAVEVGVGAAEAVAEAAALALAAGFALALSEAAVGVPSPPQATKPDIARARARGAAEAEGARSAPQKGQRGSPARTCRSQAWQGVRAIDGKASPKSSPGQQDS